jgi:hypothetical protein
MDPRDRFRSSSGHDSTAVRSMTPGVFWLPVLWWTFVVLDP